MTTRWIVVLAALFVIPIGCGEDAVEDPGQDDEVRDTDDQRQDDPDNGQDHPNGDDLCEDVDCPAGQTCDATTGDCVDEQTTECATNDDCTGDDGVCDTDRGVCVECVADDDCSVGHSCDDNNTCQEETPDELVFHAEAVPTGDVEAVTGSGFDVALDQQGQPVVAMLDYQTGEVVLAERDGDGWSTETIIESSTMASYNFRGFSQLRMDITSDGSPHIVVAALDDLIHVFEETDGWTHDVAHTLLDDPGVYRSAGIAVDDSGAVHKLGGQSSETEGGFYYERLNADGTTDAVDGHKLSFTDETIQHVDLDVRSNGLPTMLMTVEVDDPQLVAPDDLDDSQWPGGDIGATTTDFVPIAVDEDDNPWAVVSPDKGDGLESWRFAGPTHADSDQWQSEAIASSATTPWFVLHGDTPHLSFLLGGSELTYARKSAAFGWETHYVADVASGGDSRVVVDGAGAPHIVGYTDSAQLEYFTVD